MTEQLPLHIACSNEGPSDESALPGDPEPAPCVVSSRRCHAASFSPPKISREARRAPLEAASPSFYWHRPLAARPHALHSNDCYPPEAGSLLAVLLQNPHVNSVCDGGRCAWSNRCCASILRQPPSRYLLNVGVSTGQARAGTDPEQLAASRPGRRQLQPRQPWIAASHTCVCPEGAGEDQELTDDDSTDACARLHLQDMDGCLFDNNWSWRRILRTPSTSRLPCSRRRCRYRDQRCGHCLSFACT